MIKLNQRELEEYSRRLWEKDKDALSWLLRDSRGRNIAAMLAFENFMYKNTFTNNAETYHNEGRRYAVLKFFQQLRDAAKENEQLLLQAETERRAEINGVLKQIERDRVER